MEFFPILPEDEENNRGEPSMPELLPVLPLRNTVLFPGVIIPITVGRQKSMKLLKDAYKANIIIGAISQKDSSIDEPTEKDLHPMGTLAFVIKILEMPNGDTTAIIQGRNPFRLGEVLVKKPYFKATYQVVDDIIPPAKDKEFNAILANVRELAIKMINYSANIPQEIGFAIKNIENPSFLIHFVCSNINISANDKQRMLEIPDLKQRAMLLLEFLNKEVQALELKNDIQSKVRQELDQQQREYFLQQQIKTIQDELGGNPLEQEIEELRKKASKKKWSKTVAEAFEKEIGKLQRLNPAAGEYSLQVNYLQTLVELPWNVYSTDVFDLPKAQKILDADHFGLEKVKERIIEHLAVLKLKGDLKAPILCLYGPPGVGKTSLGKSIAKALKRKYVRISLGGLHDEAEIRGHRKTYIGAMPGRILQNIKKAKTSNPVFVLDEIDKVGNDFRGDPSAALLEVLDPEQNNNFYDNYLELEYDLSKVMFIATANNISAIHPALRDRMEMIEVSGYITEEKVEIAKKHLIPRQLEAHGMKKASIAIKSEAIEFIIENYTRESGVRDLDQKLAKVFRFVARQIAMEEPFNKTLGIEEVKKILGQPLFIRDKYENNDYAGVVTGLAWTSAGGEILFIETSLSRGQEKKLTITGNLGDVMKESAIIALEYIKAHADVLNLDMEIFNNWNVHIHVPEGAIPKDGPSAGITMATSLASAFTQRKVKPNLAMTGEITLRGKVLPVGGIKEKILAAKRAGITDIILSSENRKDIEEINEVYLKGLNFHFVKDIIEVYKLALLDEKVSNPLNLIIEKPKKK
ncbi:MAG TPA: endopeptidase La [Bacteroidales bacterium]|nr:endopeptidase La [Bacteroidales bacterium]